MFSYIIALSCAIVKNFLKNSVFFAKVNYPKSGNGIFVVIYFIFYFGSGFEFSFELQHSVAAAL